MRTWFAQLVCGIFSGHDGMMRKVDGDRVFLACTCGRETAGWHCNEVPPTPCTTR